MAERCPICSKGELVATVVSETISYQGADLQVPEIEISVCHVCGEEIVLPAQLKTNAVRFADAKRAHDGLLTSAEIQKFRDDLGLTQAQAAAILGGGVNAFSKYERGEVVQSKSMDLLIRVNARFPEVRRHLMSLAGVPIPNCGWISAVDVKVGGHKPALRVVQTRLIAEHTENLSDWTAQNEVTFLEAANG